MLNYWLDGGGVVEDGGEEGEVGDGISGGDNCGMHCIIKLIALLLETQSHSSSLSHQGEFKGLFPNPLIAFVDLSALLSTH